MKTGFLLKGSVVLSIAMIAGCAGGGGELVSESHSIHGVDSLEVEGTFFRIDIAGSSGQTVEAEFTIPERLRSRGLKVLHEVQGSKMRVWVEKKRIATFTPPWRGPRMLFRVPIDTRVMVNNSSGAVSVEGLDSTSLDLQVSSGRIDISNCVSKLSATSSSGSISVDRCDGGKDLTASSGRIVVIKSEGDIRAETSSGAQRYESIDGSIKARSSSGKIEIDISEGTLDLIATSGRLKGTAVTLTESSSFQTSSGSIDFDFTNSESDFRFDLRSSSGRIKAGRTQAKGTVVTGNGEIMIKGKSSSGSQTYR